jgi:hypothetical protein
MTSTAKRHQVIEVLRQRYFGMIAPLPSIREADKQDANRLSRALAAFAIQNLAEVTPAEAANAVVDGFNDNGLDAIFFDRQKNILWVVQSKLSSAPNMGDNKKFCDGVRDLIAKRYNRFNGGFARLQQEVDDALDTLHLKVVGCHVHLGGQTLGSHAVADLTQLKTELNRHSERFDWTECSLRPSHEWLANEHAAVSVDIDLALRNWNGVDQPRRAYYGLVAACDLANLYDLHGKKIFERNIRHYLGAQEVNTAISDTVQARPGEFFYLNNGLTAICSAITLLPGHTPEQGTFHLEGFSIVNGAQTVGSISTARSIHGSVSADAKTLITLIEVDSAQPIHGSEITRARNTQNAVRGLHFAALDCEQERLRREMAVSGIVYHYRPSAEAGIAGNEITVEIAALALAALSGNTRTVVAAKKESGQLLNCEGDIYPTLFFPGLAGIQLCRSVRIYQYLDDILKASEISETDLHRRSFFRHGRFFILHILSQRVRPLIEKAEKELSTPDQHELSRMLLEIAELVYTAIDSLFRRDKGCLTIFRNLTDAEPLAVDVRRRLTRLDAERSSAQVSPDSASAQTPSPANLNPPTLQPPATPS